MDAQERPPRPPSVYIPVLLEERRRSLIRPRTAAASRNRAALVELIGEDIPKLRSELYDALRDSVAEARRPSEASPAVSAGPDYRGPVRSGNRGFL